jgi:hypothetical protein
MERRKLVSEIKTLFPDIPGTKPRWIPAGWENSVLEIDGEYIFRFPNTKGRWAHQKREVTILEWLTPLGSV